MCLIPDTVRHVRHFQTCQTLPDSQTNFHVADAFPFCFITNTLPIGNLVIALTVLTPHAARLHSSCVSNPTFPYIASSIPLSINT